MLTRLPSSLFAIVLGLAGLGAGWRAAATVWGVPPLIGELVLALAAVVWAILAVGFVARCIANFEAVKAELAHPVQCCFVGLVFVATLLMVGAVRPYSEPLAWGLLALGLGGHLVYIAWRVGGLWLGTLPAPMITPVLYLPLVAGNFAATIALGAMRLSEAGFLFFGAGVLSWLAIESTIWGRLFSHEPMPPPIRPLIGIQLAPPVVGLVAYLSVSAGPPGPFEYGLLGYGLMLYLVLARLLPWVGAAGFAPSWWAFSFGVTAAPLSAILLVGRGAHGMVEPIAMVLFALANVAILGLSLGTLWLLLQGRLVPKPAAG
jgi:tellurite resistance protein